MTYTKEGENVLRIKKKGCIPLNSDIYTTKRMRRGFD